MPEYLTPAEQDRALAELARDESLAGQRDHALIATGLYAGLRCMELVNLQIPHLRFDAGVLLVVRGKGGRSREIPLYSRLTAILRAYLETTRPALLRTRAGAYVFVNAYRSGARRADRPLPTRSVWWIVSRRLRPLFGRHIHPHTLRHSFASRLRAAGAGIDLIQELLGHADIQTTMRYSHLTTAERRVQVETFLSGGATGPA